MTIVYQIGTVDTSMAPSEDNKVSKFKDLREQTGWSVFELAKEASVSPSTINRMEHGYEPVTKRMAYKVLNKIGEKIGRRVTVEELPDLKIKE